MLAKGADLQPLIKARLFLCKHAIPLKFDHLVRFTNLTSVQATTEIKYTKSSVIG